MFDENSGYQKSDVDLVQLINEPMIETSFDISNLPNSARLEEISSDEEEELIQQRFIQSKASSASKGKEKASDTNNHQNVQNLPSSSPTPAATDIPEQSENSSPFLTPTENSDVDFPDILAPAPPPSVQPPPAPKRKFYPSAPASKDITSKLDESNIIPEGVKRTRQPRKQAYAVALDHVDNGNNEAFHTAFSAHISTNEYSVSDSQKTPQNDQNRSTSSTSTKLHRDSLPTEPRHFGGLRNHPHADGFRRAMETEIAALISKGTWTEVPHQTANSTPPSIPTTWVFKYKFDEEGFLTKYKARLCARGDLQKTQQDTYAATLAARIFRALMALVNAFDLETRQYDAINAFVNSEIDEPIYLRPPAGWTGNSDVLLLLLRALYGLKQSPALWYRHFSQTLVDLGLHQVFGIECLYANDHMLIFFFVDDIAVLYDRKFTLQVDQFQKKLFAKYEMRNIGEIEWFLGIRIARDRYRRHLFLSQDSYIDKLAVKFNIDLSKKAPGSPLGGDYVKNSGAATKQEIFTYQQKVGSINYAAVITRPDIAFAASKLSEFLTNPSKLHMEAADRVLSYLGHSKDLAIKFDARVPNPQTIFLASSDASYADDIITRFSSQGYAFKLFNGIIDWKATKQKTVTTSSTEAELLAISATGKELIWWTRFFDEISLHLPHTPAIECDNRQTIRILMNPAASFSTKLRHVDIHRHWLGQEVRNQNIKVKWIPTNHILADGFTKGLPPQKHKDFVSLIGLVSRHEDV